MRMSALPRTGAGRTGVTPIQYGTARLLRHRGSPNEDQFVSAGVSPITPGGWDTPAPEGTLKLK